MGRDELLGIPMASETSAWLESEDGRAAVERLVRRAVEAFLDPGLGERLAYGNVHRPRNAMREIEGLMMSLSGQLAVLAVGDALGFDIPSTVWDAARLVYTEALYVIDEVNFQGLVQRNPDWHSDLATADIGANLALVCRLRPPLGADWERLSGLVEAKCLQPIIDDWVGECTRIHSLDSMGHNWWAVIVGGAGIMSALMGWEDRLRGIRSNLVEWFHFSGNEFSRKRPNFGERGDFVEGFGYGEYALLNPCRLASLDPGFSLIPECLSMVQAEGLAGWLKRAFVETTDGPRSLRFGDVHKGYRPNPSVWHVLARVTGDRDLLSLAHRLTPAPVGAFDLLTWEPAAEDVARVSTVLPESPSVYATSGLAFMGGDRLSVTVRAGEFWNHSHLDAGSFILCDGGVVWIDDSGTCPYGQPEYSGYHVMPQAHNVAYSPSLSPAVGRMHYEGMPITGWYLTSAGDDSVQLLRADTNILSGGALARSYRTLLLLGEEALIIWDDLSGYDERSFDFLLHTPWEVRIPDGDAPVCLVHGDYTCPLWFLSDSPAVLSVLTDEPPGVPCLRWRTEPALRQKFGLTIGAMVHCAEWRCSPDAGWECELQTSSGHWLTWFNPRADGRVMHQNCVSTWHGIETDAYALILRVRGSRESLTIIEGSFARTESSVLFSHLSRQPLMTIDSQEE